MTSTGLNPASAQTHHSTIYVSGDGRVLARKIDGTLVELGVMKPDADGLAYQLHVEGLYGLGLPTAERLLQDVAAKLADVDLDALYDALPRYTGHAAVDLELDPHLEVWTGPLTDRQ
ncbi:hypothetical protein FXN63_09740 [Pigmentiphaga aceris]|uniref:Uncharacterized protein n=1 Tax=Pigmentiphaga aceris TaxID=1940612 RepID=A0A5C0AWQ1_9BURK|nr:hypothetical protein [Pigmentiphaga aceris]QEI06084.1 hypothetical protein FXN63_09740 [Pigmentiphaga aceris]